MGNHPIWVYGLQAVIWLLAMTFVMGWLAGSRKKAALAEDGVSHLLTISKTLTIFGCVGMGFFTFCTVAAALAGERWTIWSVFLGFAAMCIPLLMETRVRHEVRAEGIRYRGAFKDIALVPWNEFRSAEYRWAMKWLEVETQSSGVLRFSAGLHGWERLADALLENATEILMDDLTYKVLEEARQGNPPSLW